MAERRKIRPLRFYVWGAFLTLIKIGLVISLVGIAFIGSLKLCEGIERITGSLMYSRLCAIFLALIWLSIIMGAIGQFLDEQKLRAEESRRKAAMAERPKPTFPPAPGPRIPPKQ